MQFLISLLVIFSLNSCKSAIQDTRTAQQILHEIEKDLNVIEEIANGEPEGCEEIPAVEEEEEKVCA